MLGVALLVLDVEDVDESLVCCVAYSRRGEDPIGPLVLMILPRKAVAKEPRHLKMSVGRM
jgi:hypothetical protein